MDGRSPLVSIIIPTFNRANLLSETIRSIRQQSVEDWELIIIDDGSEDETGDIVKAINDRRIHYVKIKHTGIFGAVRNCGLKMARGEFVAFCDSDDLWLSEKLHTQLVYLKQNTGCDFVFTNVSFFGNPKFQSPPEYQDYVGNDILLPALRENRFVFYPSSLMFRRGILQQTELMREDLRYTTDMRFFFKLCQVAKGIFIGKRLTLIRKHNSNTTADTPPEILLENILLVDELYSEGSISLADKKELVSHYYYKMGVEQLARKSKDAIFSFFNYIKTVPYHWKGWARLFQAMVYSLRQ